MVAHLKEKMNFHDVRSDAEMEQIVIDASRNGRRIYYHPASVVVADSRVYLQFLEKSLLAKEDVAYVGGQQFFGALIQHPRVLPKLLEDIQANFIAAPSMTVVDIGHACHDIRDYRHCLDFFSSGFESRHFNHVSADAETVRKYSKNAAKIRAEYNYYYLLPDGSKRWFVMPYDFKEDNDGASYQLERLLVPDVALQWVHHVFSLTEFDTLLNKIFSYLQSRPAHTTEGSNSEALAGVLYKDKVHARISVFKQQPQFASIEAYIRHGTAYNGLDHLIEHYVNLYKKYAPKPAAELVIGHGDLCFSNILYEKNISLLRLIDPKGGINLEDILTHPSYDWAKLSHSVLGDYDYINHGLFSIRLDEANRFSLQLDDEPGVLALKEHFIHRVQSIGMDMRLLRLYEASLFLSMLPLHAENAQKQFAFILKAILILEEIEANG